ncbi:MAG: hypothetical protein KJO89_01300, partial [Deltaproteobacteria bacterium]|nr:hypothetical protein [Deltaproteobacteria bacterium]
GKNASWGGVNRAIEERLATGVLAIGRPVAMAPQVDLRLGAGPIAVLPIPSRFPIEWIWMEGRGKNARWGSESTSQVTIRKTAATSDWRARRGEACLVPAPKSYRPDLQAEPFDAAP